MDVYFSISSHILFFIFLSQKKEQEQEEAWEEEEEEEDDEIDADEEDVKDYLDEFQNNKTLPDKLNDSDTVRLLYRYIQHTYIRYTHTLALL